MFDKFFGILKKVENKQEYTLTSEGDSEHPFFVSHADITVGEKRFPCDTAIDLDVGQPKGSEKVSFTTLIHNGVSGENEVFFNKSVDGLNCILPGKLARDVTDGSQDILYITTERVNGLSQKIVTENLDHHAQVKARIAPELGHLSERLGLNPVIEPSQADEFALNWNRVFTESSNLPNAPEIKFIPSEKKF